MAAPDIHILGYGIDHRDANMLDALERFRADRGARAGRMLAKLSACGLELDLAAIERRRAEGLAISRPHLAEAVLSHDGNRNGWQASGSALSATSSSLFHRGQGRIRVPGNANGRGSH